MALTDTAIRNAKPKEKPYKVTDAQASYRPFTMSPRTSWRPMRWWNATCWSLAMIARPARPA